MVRKIRAPSTQKISLASDGTVVPRRMQPFSTGQAINPPAVKMSRLRELLRSQKPKVCLVRGEGLGDVITTTPIVHEIKKQFKKVDITYATNTRYLNGALVEVLKYNPDIDNIIERQLLKEEDYDLVINLHCPCIHHEKPGNPPISRIDLFAQYVGFTLSDPVPKYFLLSQEVDLGSQKLGPLRNEKIILVQPSASSQKRSLSHKTLKQACSKLFTDHGIRSVFLTHDSDWGTDVLWENIPGSATFRDLSVREIAGLMVHCDLVLCPDSSILHLAGALEVPTVGLFGPTHPMARINHYKNAVAIWEGENYQPCPCFYTSCPINNICWTAITPSRIVDTCLTYMKEIERVDIPSLPYAEGDSIIDTEII